MRYMGIGLLTLLLVSAAWALDDKKDKDPPDKKPATPADEYKALEKEFSDKQQDYFKAMAAAKTDEERQKAFKEKYPQVPDYAARFLKLAENNATDPVGLDAASWVVQAAGQTPAGAKAMDLVLAHHVDKPKVGELCLGLIYSSSPQAVKLLRSVLEKNKNHDAQGMAAFGLASYLKNNAERSTGTDDAKAKEAERLFERVEKDFGDVKSRFGKNLSALAKGELFEIRNLVIGKEAPDIQGQDVEGKSFKLSDYRGKVVVLDFWGNW
jgi:hypothetical protein